MKTISILIAACALLAGCAGQKHVEIQRVKVPVPVECREREPERPVMPTEALAPGVALFELVRAALAEIDRREGYEVRLRTALLICTTPVAAKPAEGAR
jgi:hypothetical protein